MAQAKKTKATETEGQSAPEEKHKGAIYGQLIKFGEAIKIANDVSPLQSASNKEHIIKLLPNGWATVQKGKEAKATLVPAGNILYFIPE